MPSKKRHIPPQDRLVPNRRVPEWAPPSLGSAANLCIGEASPSPVVRKRRKTTSHSMDVIVHPRQEVGSEASNNKMMSISAMCNNSGADSHSSIPFPNESAPASISESLLLTARAVLAQRGYHSLYHHLQAPPHRQPSQIAESALFTDNLNAMQTSQTSTHEQSDVAQPLVTNSRTESRIRDEAIVDNTSVFDNSSGPDSGTGTAMEALAMAASMFSNIEHI